MTYRHLLLTVGIVGLSGCQTLDSLLPFGLGETNEDKIIAEANSQGQVSNNLGPAIGFAVRPDLSKGKCGQSPGVKSSLLNGLKKVAQVSLASSDLAGSKVNPTCIENYVARFADADSLLDYSKKLPALKGASGMTEEFYKGLVSYAAGTGDIDMYHQLMTQKPGPQVANILKPLRANSASFTTAYARLPWDKQLSVVKAQYDKTASLDEMQLPLGAINDMASDRMQGIAEQYNSLVKKYHTGVQSLPTQATDVAANPSVALPKVVTTAPATPTIAVPDVKVMAASEVEVVVAQVETVTAPTAEAIDASVFTSDDVEEAVAEAVEAEPVPVVVSAIPTSTQSLDAVEAVPVAVVTLESEPKVAVITEPVAVPQPEPAVAAPSPAPVVVSSRIGSYRKASALDLRSGPTSGASIELGAEASSTTSSWNTSYDNSGSSSNNPWLTLKKLYGSDHKTGRLRRVWIREQGEGYQVKFKNWIQLTCDLSLDAAGNPSAMRNCVSAKGWKVEQSNIPLSCAKSGKEMVCSGRYKVSNDGVTETTTARIIHLLQ